MTTSPWTPLGLLLTVVGLDSAQDARRWSVPISGLLDEPAHLCTSGVVLLAVAGSGWLRRHGTFTLAALIASVAIDADHIPLYLGVPGIADGGRPYSHSVATVAALIVCAVVVRRRRNLVLGLAVGVLLHFIRDIATGPGLPLLWPVDVESIRLPYHLYLLLLICLALLASGRNVKQRRLSGH